MHLPQIRLVPLRRRLDRLITRVPIRRTHLSHHQSLFRDHTSSSCHLGRGMLTSPYLSVNWKASMSRSVSSTLRPTGRSLIVIYDSVSAPPSDISCTLMYETYLSNNPTRINQKQSSQRNALLFNQNAIVLANLMILVAE